jgi:hypothetical protein
MRPLLRHAALAAALVAPGLLFAQNTESAKMVPAQMNAAGFLNAAKILEDYGMLFDGGPLAAQLDQYVAMGMPDPRTEGLREIGLAGMIDSMEDDEFSVYVTRDPGQQPEFAGRIAAFLKTAGLAGVEESAYHGVKLFSLRDLEKDKVVAQIADLGDTEAFGSMDESGKLAFAKLSVDTASGQNETYAQKYGTQLGENDYITASFEVPKKFRDELRESAGGMFSFLSTVVHARLALSKEADEVRLALDGVTMDEEEAIALKNGLETFFNALKERFGGQAGEYAEILNSVKFFQDGNTATVSVALPEKVVEELVGALTGNED